jgi:hypothetical protein
MIKLVKRSTRKASSSSQLKQRVEYLVDRTHENHQNKSILPPRNCYCSGNSPEEFIAEVLRLDNRYQKARKGKPGRVGRRLFEEIVYSSPKGARLSNEERSEIEQSILNLIGNSTACRIVWHIDRETSRADMHMLLAARTHSRIPSTTLWGKFRKNRHIFYEFDMCDTLIVHRLNRTRSAAPLQTAKEIHQARYRIIPLARELAMIANGPVTEEKLDQLIQTVGHSVQSKTEKTIQIKFRDKIRGLRYNICKLLEEINSEIEKLSCEQSLEHDDLKSNPSNQLIENEIIKEDTH